jgi:competence ComEA-like helix-hairpin-helix protein
MNNLFCIGSGVLRVNPRRRSFRKSCRVIVLLTSLSGFLTNEAIPAQARQSNQEKGQGKTQSVGVFNSISPSESEKININLAGVEELQSLPGIGVVTAKRIVDYRKKNPPFRKIEELLIIRGISKNRLEQIRNRISVN